MFINEQTHPQAPDPAVSMAPQGSAVRRRPEATASTATPAAAVDAFAAATPEAWSDGARGAVAASPPAPRASQPIVAGPGEGVEGSSRAPSVEVQPVRALQPVPTCLFLEDPPPMSTHVEQPAEGRGALASGPAIDPADQAALDKLEEACRSEEVKAAMEAERLRSQQRIAAVWAELETECLRIWHEVMLHRQKVMDDLFDKWCKVLTG